jgi:uncharacterized protein (DUF433 family)
MTTSSETVIVRDPEILSGQPIFRGTRVPFQASLTTWRAETRWMNSSNSTPVSPANGLSLL